MTQETCWTLIRSAAGGDRVALEDFAVRYGEEVRTYLSARWQGTAHQSDMEDAAQEVFVRCFKPGGVLERAESLTGGFRAFLLGVTRNVAREIEAKRMGNRRGPTATPLDELPNEEERLTRVFDRAWAFARVREARGLMTERAAKQSEREQKRVELLRLRFQEGLPIRAIAEQWGVDAAELHHEYATARDEFKSALRTIVSFHAANDVERECKELLALIAG